MIVEVPVSVMALEIVSPSELDVNKGELEAAVVVIDALLRASVPPVIVKVALLPVATTSVPEFVNDSESIRTVPTLFVPEVLVVPPNTSENVPVVLTVVAGLQFAAVPQLELLDPFHDAIVPPKDGVEAAD